MTFEEIVVDLLAIAPSSVSLESYGSKRAQFLYSDPTMVHTIVSIDTDGLFSHPIEISFQTIGPKTEIFLDLHFCEWLGKVKSAVACYLP